MSKLIIILCVVFIASATNIIYSEEWDDTVATHVEETEKEIDDMIYKMEEKVNSIKRNIHQKSAKAIIEYGNKRSEELQKIQRVTEDTSNKILELDVAHNVSIMECLLKSEETFSLVKRVYSNMRDCEAPNLLFIRDKFIPGKIENINLASVILEITEIKQMILNCTSNHNYDSSTKIIFCLQELKARAIQGSTWYIPEWTTNVTVLNEGIEALCKPSLDCLKKSTAELDLYLREHNVVDDIEACFVKKMRLIDGSFTIELQSM